MKYVKNMVLVALLSTFMVNMIPVTSFAASANDVEIKTDTINYLPGGYEVQKAQIITKYRTHNGKVQYRRWNITTGKWVDPYLINL